MNRSENAIAMAVRAPRAGALALLLLVLGCSERERGAGEPEARSARATPGVERVAAHEPEEPILVRFQPTERPRTRAEELAREVEPELEDWECEALGLPMEQALVRLGELLARPGSLDSAALRAFAAEDFACDELAPAKLESVRDAAGLSVQRWDPSERAERGSERGPGRFAAALGSLVARLRASGDACELRFELRLTRVERQGEEVAALLRYSASGLSKDAGVEQSAQWRCRFAIPRGPAAPLFRDIALERFAETRLVGARTIFEDRTFAVLGSDPTYRAQVLPGVDHWTGRIGNLLGMTNIGHHGLALGDVDGDGLEDLYVCEEGGLPNRLYRQKQDGTLEDIAAAAGVDYLDHSASALLLDLDNDGDQDLVVAMRGLLVFDQNNGAGRFSTRVRIPTGIGSMSLSAADHDSDGDLDVYCCMYNSHAQSEGIAFPYHRAENGEANLFLRNAGGFRFVECAAEVGLDQNNSRYSFAAVWEDFDEDGDPDLYIANDFGRNNLYRNDGGRFTDVAPELGVEDVASGMSAAVGDYDRDGRMDIYVGNLYSSAAMRITHSERFARGRPAEEVLDLRRMARGNTLYRQKADGSFEDRSVEAGVNMGRWAWASPFADIDGDGWEDLVVLNGYYTMPDPTELDSFFWRHVVARSPRERPTERELREYTAWWLAMTGHVKRGRSYNGHERNCAYLNLRDGSFAEVSALAGVDLPEDGRSLALVDWDGDGALDLWVRNRSSPRLRLLVNQLGPAAGERAFVALRLQGTRSNRDAIGARVEVVLEGGSGEKLQRGLRAGEGFLGQSTRWLSFGLGRETRIRRVDVRWPSGARESFEGVVAGRRYELVEGSGRAVEWQRPGGNPRLAPDPQPTFAESELASIFLPARFPAPILRYVPSSGGAPREIETGRGPLLVLLVASWSPEAVQLAAELSARSKELRALGLDVLALDVAGMASPLQPIQGADLARPFDFAAFAFRSGRATPELADKLELVQDFLFDRTPPACVPFGLLLDGAARVSAIYRGRPALADLELHLGTLDAVRERRYEVGAPFPGRWKLMAADIGELPAANWFVERYPEDSERYYQSTIAGSGGASGEGGSAADRSRALFRMAELRLSNGKRDEARALALRAAELDPANADAERILGDVFMLDGDAAAAFERYRGAVERNPRLAAAHYGLGHAAASLGRADEARAAYLRAVELVPNHPEANNNLGLLLLEGRDLAGAIPRFEAAIAGDPTLASSHYMLGAALAMQGEQERARASYKRALELQPSYLDLHLQRGEGLAAEGRTEEALAHYGLVLELRPDSPRALLRRAQAHARSGAPSAALADLERAEALASEPALREEIAALRALLQ